MKVTSGDSRNNKVKDKLRLTPGLKYINIRFRVDFEKLLNAIKRSSNRFYKKNS